LGFGGRWDWREADQLVAGLSAGDRQFARALRRLTRLNTRSVEQPVNLDEATTCTTGRGWRGEMGDWKLTEPQAARLRDYLLRGGS